MERCLCSDITSGKSSLWVNHEKTCDFACLHAIYPCLIVVHFDDASGFNGYIESVEMYYYQSIPSGLIAVRMTYLCEQYKIPKKAGGNNINRSRNEDFFHIEMASQTDTTLDQLNHIIDTPFSSVAKFEPFDRYTALQSLYTALDHQLQDGQMAQQEFDLT